jgi:hypothetical protein
VISHLLTAIAQTLQSGLQERFPQSAGSIVVSNDRLDLPKRSPYIRLYPGKVSFPHNGRDSGTIAPNSTQLHLVKEFQQEFFLEIYDPSIQELETCSSLTFAILSTSHDTLLKTYNQGHETLPKTEYHSAPFHTLHTLSQIQLLEAIPITTETTIGLQLRGNAIGQITMTRSLPQGTIPIKSISLTSELKEA